MGFSGTTDTELYSGHTRIDDDEERNLAFYLMLYGKWPSSGPNAKIEKDEIMSVEFVNSPVEKSEEQAFAIIGELSGMISRRYDELTTKNGEVDSLSPDVRPGSLGIMIDPDYKWRFLPLWRFHLKPTLDR